MLEFDQETAALLDRAYRGRDFVRRRHANIAALDPKRGQRLLDIGCGTGLLLRELAAAVGAEGRVAGIDLSADMLKAARAACAGDGNIEILEGRADALPFADASFDGIVSVQVFEYFDDLRPALAECARVLKPGGRLVIGDMDFETLHWASDDPECMARMIRAWDGHFADRIVPARLLNHLADAGFAHQSSVPVTFLDTERREDGLARMMQILMAQFAASRGALPEEDIRAWAEEQDRRAAEGRFYFCFTHGITVAERL